MGKEAGPLAEKVRKAVNRHTSPRRLAWPTLRVLLRVGMFCLTVGACLYGVHALWIRAMADPRFRLDGETLSLAGAVRECPESVTALEEIGKRFNGRSLLDPLLVSDMEKAYGGNMWVKKVTRLRRRFPNRMDIEFLLRLPAAQVWNGDRYWLVDADAVLLPSPGAKKPFPELPEIVGVTAAVIAGRPASPGEEWRDEGVSGGLGILRAFWGSPLADVLPVRRVVVNAGAFQSGERRGRDARRRFDVVSTGGAVVRWGAFNPGDLPGELTSAEKLWSLQELLRNEEALRPGVAFDVRTRLPGFSLVE